MILNISHYTRWFLITNNCPDQNVMTTMKRPSSAELKFEGTSFLLVIALKYSKINDCTDKLIPKTNNVIMLILYQYKESHYTSNIRSPKGKKCEKY